MLRTYHSVRGTYSYEYGRNIFTGYLYAVLRGCRPRIKLYRVFSHGAIVRIASQNTDKNTININTHNFVAFRTRSPVLGTNH